MRKHLFFILWSLLLVVSCSVTNPPPLLPDRSDRGTAGVILRQTTVTEQVINPIALYKESYALLIGASAYKHWPELGGVLDDVTAVQAALEQQGFTVTLVLNPDRATLTAAFDNFINQYGLDANNRLLIYFAGHGYTTKKTMGEMGYIVPVDAPNPLYDLKGFLRFGLDMAQIEVYAQRIDSKHALFVFDSCFSGSVFALSGRGSIMPPVITYKTAMPVRQFITSGSADEEVPDVSMFRKQFVSGLDGEADSNGDGYITGKELGMFLEDKVINYSKDTQHPQFGTIRNPELDKGDFVFQVAGSEQSPPPQPETSVLLPSQNNGISFTDLEANDKMHKDRAARSVWDKWQERMQSDFDKAAGFAGSAVSQREAWARFLTAYADDNTFSEEDERLRKEAKRRQSAVKDAPVVIVQPPPVVVPDRKPFEPVMVDIPSGCFMMGSPESETGRSDDEGPQHRVCVKAFKIGKYEITFAEYDAFAAATGATKPSDSGWGRGRRPVINVTWANAVAYTEWLTQQTGKAYRLPSEAEWEYAARAGTTTPFWSGECISTDQANYDGNYAYGNCGSKTKTGVYRQQTLPVGSLAANPWGLYDVAGNVWEWNQDKWHDSYTGAPTDGSAWEAGDSNYRMLRGGSWLNSPVNCRAANRINNDNSDNDLGFRVALPARTL